MEAVKAGKAYEVGSRKEARRAARQRMDRRGALIAFVSSVVVLGGLAALIFTSPGWPDVRETFFSASAFSDSFPEILKAFRIDVAMFIVVEIVVLVWGLAVALIRTSRGPALFPLRFLAAGYCDIFRGIPTILLVYLIGFGIPALGLAGLPTDPIILGGFALALSYGAYVSEVYRAGLLSVHKGQKDAALAIGLNERQSLRFVVLPQAVRRVIPPLLNDFIALQKDVALVAILGVVEAFRVAQIDAASNFNYTPLLAAALLYLIVTVPLARILDRMDLSTGGKTK